MSMVDLPDRLKRYDGQHVVLKRVSLTQDQLAGLPSFPASDKSKDPRYGRSTKNYGNDCWELDALDPNLLQDRVRKAIESHIEPEAWERCKVTERAEHSSLLSPYSATHSSAPAA